MTQRLDQLKKLHAADPADPFCTYGIALEHAKAGRAGEAVEWLDKTIAIDPHYCYAYFQKGKILSENGDPAAGKAVLEHGIKTARSIANNPDAAHAAEEMTALLDSIE